MIRVPRPSRRFTPRLKPHKLLKNLRDSATAATVVVTVVLPWAAVTLARSLDTAACPHRTTLATRSVATIFSVCKPVVPNVRPALVLVLSSAPARCLAARAVVAAARASVPPETVKALDLHRDQALPHNKRRRRRHTSTPLGKQYPLHCTNYAQD